MTKHTAAAITQAGDSSVRCGAAMLDNLFTSS